jgi:hypothetical protein
MPRNQETKIKGEEALCPLTERILAQMGPEGRDIRKRLQSYYKKRTRENQALPEPLEDFP